MEVTCGKTSHLTKWTLYPLTEAEVFYDPVDSPDQRIDGRTFRPESFKVMCHHCGVIWAERVNFDLPNDNWSVKRWPCQACDGGSLWDAWNEPWNRSLPYGLLVREMNLIKGWYDQGIRSYHQFFQFRHFRRKV